MMRAAALGQTEIWAESSENVHHFTAALYRGLSVLHRQLDCDLQALPVGGGLGDILPDLLGGEPERSDLGGEGGGGADLPAHHAELDDLDLIRVKLGRHGCCVVLQCCDCIVSPRGRAFLLLAAQRAADRQHLSNYCFFLMI